MIAGLVLFYSIFQELFSNLDMVVPTLGILGLFFATILYLLYDSITKIQTQLEKINRDLLELKPTSKELEKGTLLSQEFVTIHTNLHQVLVNAKKREIDKQKYTAKLKLKNRQRSDMLSAIAHEFRNPISAIMGYSQTLQDDPNISRPLTEKFLSKIFSNSQKIEDLLARLILWNKFESGETKLHLSSFDLLLLVHEVKQSLEDKYKQRDIVIESIALNKVSILADYTLMEIVIKNIIENALKYSQEDVVVRVEQNSISIIDKGLGISSEDIGKVTKKFYRSGTHSWDNSMGLGLAIVKTILSLHKMNLQIKSTKGIGSSFSFSFYQEVSEKK